MDTLYIYFDTDVHSWIASVADEVAPLCKYQFAGSAVEQQAAIRALAAKMQDNQITGWNTYFVGVDDQAVGMELMNVEQIYYGEGISVWSAPEIEPEMTALMDLVKAGGDFLEILAEAPLVPIAEVRP